MAHELKKRIGVGGRAAAIITVASLFLGCGGGGGGSGGGSSVATPTVEGPVTGGNGKPVAMSTTFDLARVGYVEAEYFISGTATAYTSAAPLADDGIWTTIVPGETAPYKTRILVYRPSDPARFNGTVVVEWLNVSGCIDFAGAWVNAHAELIRSGYAWVGVSAQALGVEGTGPLAQICTSVFDLKHTDPARYASLLHPGDSFSYDIFSQAARAVRRSRGTRPLGDLHPERLIAVGQSQSAHRMVTYIDAVHPLARVYDAFIVDGRGTSASVAFLLRLSEPPQEVVAVPGTTRIRADLDVPTIAVEPESFLVEPTQNGLAARQPDGDRFRLWEIPGAADGDTYLFVTGPEDVGGSPAAASLVVTPTVFGLTCNAPINSGPHHFVSNAAVAALDRWLRDGTPAPSAPRVETAGGVVLRDAQGNALGGVRTPQLDVPIATLSGAASGGSLLCLVFGNTVPLDDATLRALYADHDAYVEQFAAATDRAVAAGFVLPPDAALMKAAAEESDVAR